MNCIFCGTPLSNMDYCTGCGVDITLQKRIVRISNLLYNQGLEKAMVRDLSGAIVCLKRSLKFNKENIDARNLLGLVYYETGEVVSALSEWVISKNMKVPNNIADRYIEELQSHKNKLDIINKTIRKYNQALQYCRQDNEDMAMIQLKKVLAQNPRLIKAYHLQALLHLKKQEYEKARKLLKKAAYIDATNTTTLRYLQEVEAATGISTSLDAKHKKRYAKEKINRLTGTTTYMNGNEMIIQPTTFRESSAVATLINIIFGLLFGGAIVWFLVVPGMRQSINDGANKQVTDANSKMASEVVKVQGLEEEIENYKKKIEQANKTMDEANTKVNSYEDLLAAADAYVMNPTNQAQAANILSGIDENTLTGSGKELYTHMMAVISDYVYNDAVSAANTAYTNQNYQDAIIQYQKALEAKPGDAWSLLYLGHSYRASGDTGNADRVFGEFIQKYPARGSEVESYITGAITGNRTGQNPTDNNNNRDNFPATNNGDAGTENGNPGGITGADRLGITQQ